MAQAPRLNVAVPAEPMLTLAQPIVAFRNAAPDVDRLFDPPRIVAAAGIANRFLAVLGIYATRKRVRKSVQVLRIERARPTQPFVVIEEERCLAFERVFKDWEGVGLGLEAVAEEALERCDVLVDPRRQRTVRPCEIEAVTLTKFAGIEPGEGDELVQVLAVRQISLRWDR